MKESALPETIKSSTITQEVIRRMSNTSRDVTQSRRNLILEEYLESLKRSGYNWVEIEKYCTPGS